MADLSAEFVVAEQHVRYIWMHMNEQSDRTHAQTRHHITQVMSALGDVEILPWVLNQE